MTPELPFRLAPYERHNEVWLKVNKHLTERLFDLRRQNDGDLTPEETAKLRGRIAEIKVLQDLATDLPIQPPSL